MEPDAYVEQNDRLKQIVDKPLGDDKAEGVPESYIKYSTK